MFGKVMSLSDDTMWIYFDLISFLSTVEIKALKGEVKNGLNPRDVKFKLAGEIVARFHGETAAQNAHAAFVAQFQQGAIPEDMPEITLSAKDGLVITQIIKMAGLTESTSEATRMIKQGAVRLDGERMSEYNKLMTAGESFILQVGKRRFAKIILT